MKIFHINIYSNSFAGTEKYLFDICRDLKEKGNEVSVISSTNKNNWPGIRHYTIGSSYGLRSTIKVMGFFKEIIRREAPDVIHLHNTQGYLSPFIIQYLHQAAPLVRTIHDSRPFCPGNGWKVIPASSEICNYPMGLRCFKNGCYPFYHDDNNPLRNIHKFLLMIYETRILKQIEMILVASSFMYNDSIRNGYYRENVSLIPLYTDKVTMHEPEIKKNDKKTILYASRVEKLKGVMQFIESLGLLKSNDWQAVILGEGPAKEEAKKLVKMLGLDNSVSFYGFVPSEEIDKHYENSSIVALPSVYPEPFGLVGIEAMAFGKPVVAFDSGGIRDWLVNNETGFLVKRGDVMELSSKLSQLLEDESLATKMGQNGKVRVDKLYRKDIHIKRLLKVYEEVIERQTQKKSKSAK